MNTKRFLLPLSAIVLLAVSFISVSAQGKAEGAAMQSNILETPRNDFAGTFIGKASADLGGGLIPYIFTMTFHEDGTCDSNSSIDLVPPAASTARGEWRHIGGNQVAATLVGTLINSVNDPTLIGTFKLTELYTFNRRRDQIINGRVRVDVFDVDGNLLFSFEGTLTEPAKLVKVEVLH